jgi:hypothetical protein
MTAPRHPTERGPDYIDLIDDEDDDVLDWTSTPPS